MVLGDAHATLNLVEPVGVALHICIGEAQTVGSGTVVAGRQHLDVLEYGVDTKLSVVVQ